jgi:uncharacterized membrane protein (UPF0127 family)
MKTQPLPAAWLMCEGRVLASADIANTAKSRRRGLIGQTSIDSALVISPCKWIHSIGMKCAIDVLYLDDTGLVVKTEHLKPMRIAAPVGRSKTIVEMPSGSIERFGVQVGDLIEVRSA